MVDRRRVADASMTYEAPPERDVFGRSRQVAIDVVAGQGEGSAIALNVDNGSYRITPYTDVIATETQNVRCFVCGLDGRKKNLDTFRDLAEVVYALNGPFHIDVDGRSPGLLVSADINTKICVVKLG